MNRPNWYSDEPPPPGRFQIPPIQSWSGTLQLVVLLVVMLFLQLTLDAGKYLWLDGATPANPLRWYRFVTYALAHSEQSLWHLFFNCLFIWVTGPVVEAEIGSRRGFFWFCAAAAAFAGLAWLVVELIGHGAAGTLIGASGIVYALIVAFAAFDPQRIVVFWVISMKAWVLALLLMLFALFNTLMSQGGDVAHVAHLAGGVFGFGFVRYRGRVDDIISDMEQRRQTAARAHESETRREVDRILDKINQTGMSSLTKAERRFLETASRELQRKR